MVGSLKNEIFSRIAHFLLFFSFLQDSLDLSHDEIHRSLQANMAANRSNGHAVDLNPMEFIEQNGGKIFSIAFFKFRFQNSIF
jgi:hypothetical protein